MIVRTINGRRYISPSDVAHVIPYRCGGTHAFIVLTLDTGEQVKGIACVDDIEHLMMVMHSVEHPLSAA